MAFLGEYRLLWASSAREGTESSAVNTDGPTHCEQFVFEKRGEEPLAVGLRRAKSFADVMRALGGSGSGGAHIGLAVVVALLSLLGGNLIATGRWGILLGSVMMIGVSAVAESRAGLLAVVTADMCAVGHTIAEHEVSLYWFLTTVVALVFGLLLLEIILSLVIEDPRGYVMIPEGPDSGVIIENKYTTDVKLLVFDDTDAWCVVPQGGLLSGIVVPRGASTHVGDRPPYIVKVYAPWERELGMFEVPAGRHSFQATVPPLLLRPEDQPVFLNSTEERVNVCVCEVDSWTRSLWLPLAPLFARLRYASRQVEAGGSFPLAGSCILHVHGSGLLILRHCATCVVCDGEGVEYLGCLTWTGVKSRVSRSCSSLADHVR